MRTTRTLHILYCYMAFSGSMLATDPIVFIWDIKDTLYTRCEWKLTEQLPLKQVYNTLGWWKACTALKDAGYYELPYTGPTTREEILTILHTATGHTYPVYYDNQPLPNVIQKWLINEHDTENAITIAKDAIEKSNAREHTRALAQFIVPLMFDPQSIASTLTPNQSILPILNKISNTTTCSNCMFSNLHTDVIQYLHDTPDKHEMLASQYFPEDAIHTSYTHNVLKPTPKAIDQVAKSQETCPRNCIVIEPEEHHHTEFKEHDICSIHYRTPQQLTSEIHTLLMTK